MSRATPVPSRSPAGPRPPARTASRSPAEMPPPGRSRSGEREGRRSTPEGRPRSGRAWWRRQRAAVRRRLAAAPPEYPDAPADGDEGELPGAFPAAGRSRPRRTRLRLALAALPLIVAVALLGLAGRAPEQGPSPGDPAAAPGAPAAGADGDDSGPRGVPLPRGPAALAGTGGLDPTPGSSPGLGSGAVTVPGTGDAGGVDAGHGPQDAGGGPLPSPAPGHRPVAVRIGDPAALSLVGAGDRVDVVGMDGSVLAEDLEVLQGGAHGPGPAVVLSVPDGRAAALAASALSLELTVIRSATSP